MKYAITDIETTGSHASGNSIIEIGICIVEDDKIIEEFHSLLNPGVNLPPYITALTGIQTHMLEGAPTFEDIAEELSQIFEDAIFVAHNVNFDYSFIKAEFDAVGLKFNPPRLCTIKLARKAFPGLRSYGLGNLCRDLEITNDAPHRALGDARATTTLFYQAMARISEEDLKKLLHRNSTENFLPQHIERAVYDAIPERTGVYYFLNSAGKPIYIGKAKNIKKRIRSHLSSGSLGSAKHQGFIKETHSFRFRETGNELIALLWEDAEIRKYWPAYNRAQKAKTNYYNIITYTDQKGFNRLAVHKGKYASGIIKSFTSSYAAKNWLLQLAERFEMDLRLFGVDTGWNQNELPDPEAHNAILEEALISIQDEAETVVLVNQGKTKGEVCFILVEQGLFQGFGYVPYDTPIHTLEEAKNYLEKLPVTEVNQSIVLSLLENPSTWKKIKVSNMETSI